MTTSELFSKVKAEIYKLHNRLPWGACAAQLEMKAYCKDEAYKEVIEILDRVEKENEEAEQFHIEDLHNEITKATEDLDGCVIREDDGSPEAHLIFDVDLRKFARHFFDFGAKAERTLLAAKFRAKEPRWIPVTESLPPVDEEVIVLSNIMHGKPVPSHYISFGHIVDRRYCMDYDGWNFPGVTHWMHCPELPE